jgi:cardiolipin synthase
LSETLKSAVYWVVPEVLASLGFLLALVFVAHLLRQKRSPTSTISWLLVVLLLPYVGVPLYLMFGGRKMSRLAGRKERMYRRSSARDLGILEGQTERLLASYGVPPASQGNQVTLVPDGVEAYRQLIRIIDEARTSIHITTYILGRDEVGEALVDRLRRRAEEGVTVRLLLDDVGSWRVGRRFLAPLIEAGARVAFFMPMLHLPFRGRTNLRNHRKLVVVDDRIAITGGMNLAFPYMSGDSKDQLWRDLSVIVEGPGVTDLNALFASDWKFATREELGAERSSSNPPVPERHGSAAVQVVASGPDVSDDPLYESLVSLIFAARSRIWIVTPYFVPDEMLARALNLAARRGVDVRVIVPERSNHLSADLARASYLRDLVNAGGRVLLYRPVMIHAKAVLFDEQLAVIGSANMDMRSLFLNYELALFIYSSDLARITARWVESLMIDCQPELPRPNRWRELAENVVRLLAPLL